MPEPSAVFVVLDKPGHEGRGEVWPHMSERDALGLPGGYWATEITGAWYLFSPRDVLLAGPVDAVTVQRHAWCDAWRRIDRELNDEVVAFRDGTRPLQDLPKLRQCFHMWDAVAKDGPESEQRSNAAWPSRRGRATLVASAVIAALATAILGIGPEGHRPAVSTTVYKPAAQVSATVVQKHPLPTPHQVIAARVVPPAAKAVVPHTTSRILRPPKAAYVVVIGTFESSSAAEEVKHLAQRKGYVVHVVLQGAVSNVMTAPMRTRTQAEGVARGLEAVGLQAQLKVWREQ